jgi:hypothetical protein
MGLKTAVLILVFLFLAPIPPSSGQPFGMNHGPGMGMRPWRGKDRCWKASDLHLSVEQSKELDLIQQSHLRDTQGLRAELFLKRLELSELLINPAAKPEAIRSKSAEINELQSGLDGRIVEYLIRIRGLLTKEQLKRWCPDLEIPHSRRMMHGPGSMGSIPPERTPSQERLKED